MIKREVLFILDDAGKPFLQRPTGWMAGWLRYLWFFHLVGKRPHNASPEYWEILRTKYETFRLIEFEDGTHQIVNKW